MVRVLPTIDYPQALLAHLKTFGGYFPDKVKWDSDTHTVEVTEQMPLELRVSMSYLNLVGDIQDVMDNIELVLADLVSLSERPPQDPKEGERRYFLLTKLFFYELLRIRDAIPRFLKRFEEHGLMSKEDRHATKKLMEQQLSDLTSMPRLLNQRAQWWAEPQASMMTSETSRLMNQRSN